MWAKLLKVGVIISRVTSKGKLGLVKDSGSLRQKLNKKPSQSVGRLRLGGPGRGQVTQLISETIFSVLHSMCAHGLGASMNFLFLFSNLIAFVSLLVEPAILKDPGLFMQAERIA